MSDIFQRGADLSFKKQDFLFSEERARIPQAQTPPQEMPANGFPLSFAQERLWFLDQLVPNNPAYNMPAAARLDGRLDVEVLDRSIAEIVRRHESLRTSFSSIQGQAFQTIRRSETFRLSCSDLRRLSPAVREAEGQRLILEEAERPFDLVEGPLLRMMLLRLDQHEHILLLTMHHIVSDGWSMKILLYELKTLYEAFTAGKPSPLPALPIQYVDFAVWQRQWLRGSVLETQLGYWTRQLQGMQPLELPTDHPRPPTETAPSLRVPLAFSPSLSAQLKELSRRANATLYMTLLAAFQTLLFRYSGQQDISVGSPIANRNRLEIEGIIGFFVNTLVMRTRLSGNLTFLQLLERVSEVALDAYAHQDLPFEKLVEELQPERKMNLNPLFQVSFVFQNAPSASFKLPELEITPIAMSRGFTRYDLELHVWEAASGLQGLLIYNTLLFEPDTIQRMLQHFQTLLESCVAQPQQRLWDIPLLSTSERQQLLFDWNPLTNSPATACLHTLFEQQVIRTPDAIALVADDEQLSYRELNARANQLAHHLQQGSGPETLVALCLPRSLDLLIGILGVLKAGAAYLPIEPQTPAARLTFLLADAQAALLLTHSSHSSLAQDAQLPVLCLDNAETALRAEPTSNPVNLANPQSLAYVIYTSGSTGTPKGVPVSHAQVSRLFAAAASANRGFQFTQDDRWTLFHSAAFDFSVWELWGALLFGGRLVVVPYWQSRSPQDFATLLHQQAITVLNQTPSAFRALGSVVAALPAALALRLVIFGGEALEPASLLPWFARFGDRLPQLVNMYGITETAVHVTAYPLALADAQRAGSSPIGRPLPDLAVYLLDAQMQPVPIGVAGELYVGGAGLSRGYLHRPELSAERFVPHPFSQQPGARLYKTGDRARWRADGSLEYLGRLDQQVKLRGYRIELGEIEAVLQQHPAVLQAVVLLREMHPGDQRLVACVVLAPPAASEPPRSMHRQLRSFLQGHVPDYMVPSSFLFLEALPLTPNGKIDRRGLATMNLDEDERDDESVLPRTPLEEAVARLWEQILARKSLSVHDNFFEAGGHSLLATQLVAHIRASLQVELPLRCIFEAPTIAQLAAVIEQKQAELIGQLEGEELAHMLAELEEHPDGDRVDDTSSRYDAGIEARGL